MSLLNPLDYISIMPGGARVSRVFQYTLVPVMLYTAQRMRRTEYRKKKNNNFSYMHLQKCLRYIEFFLAF